MVDAWGPWLSWLTSNPFTKGLALLMAVTAWLFVQQDVAQQTAVTARIRWVLPADLVPTEPLRSQVQVVVEGPRAATNRAARAPLEQRILLEGLPTGEHAIDLVALEWPSLPPSVQIVRIDPPTLSVVLDERAEQKVRVLPKLIGDPPPAYEIRKTRMEPRVVTVRGPRSVVSPLVEVPTKPLDVSMVTQTLLLDAPLDLPRGVTVLGSNPQATIEVEEVGRTLDGLVVPVHVYGAPGAVPEPRTVTVRLEGPATQLEAIEARRAADRVAVVAFVRWSDAGSGDGVARYEASRGPRLEIWHPGGPDVLVKDVQPRTVRVEQR